MANEFYTEMPTKQYASTLDLLSQEHSVLYPKVWNRGTAKGADAFYNQLEPFDMTFGRSRYDATSFSEPEYARRRIQKTTANVAIPLDDIDLVDTLVDPKSDLSRNGLYAAGRAKDKVIWNGIYSSAATGQDGGTAVAFDSTMIVDEDIGTANSGLNLEKLLAGVELIQKRSVNLEDPMNELTLFISPSQWNDYLQIQKLTSSDYMNHKGIVDGKIMGIAGISEVIVTNMVPYVNTAGTGANVDLSGAGAAWATGGAATDVDTTKLRSCTLIAKSGVGYASWKETQVRTDERTDLNYIWQLWIEQMCGATRLDEDKVVMIQAAETGYSD